jgi:hypothetical protein
MSLCNFSQMVLQKPMPPTNRISSTFDTATRGYRYSPPWTIASDMVEVCRAPYSTAYTASKRHASLPSFEFHDVVFDHQECYRILSSSLGKALLKTIPREYWANDKGFITEKNCLKAAVQIDRLRRMYDTESLLYREITLFSEFLHGTRMHRLDRIDRHSPTSSQFRVLWRPVSLWPDFRLMSLISNIQPEGLEIWDPESYNSLLSTHDVCILEGWKHLMSQPGKSAARRILESSEKILQMNLRHTLDQWCSRWRFSRRPAWRLWHHESYPPRDFRRRLGARTAFYRAFESGPGPTPDVLLQQGNAMIRDILSNDIPSDGLSGKAAVCLVAVADCLRFVPNLELYRFCSSNTYV